MTVKGVLIFNLVAAIVILACLFALAILVYKMMKSRARLIALLTQENERLQRELTIAQADKRCAESTLAKYKATAGEAQR